MICPAFEPPSTKEGKKQHNTQISLRNRRGDTLLRINIRPERNEIAFNCKAADQRHWDGHYWLAWPDIYRAFGPNHDRAKIKIAEVGERYHIYFNDNYIGSYDKHYGGDAVDVQYSVQHPGEPSMFSHTLSVKVSFMSSDSDSDSDSDTDSVRG